MSNEPSDEAVYMAQRLLNAQASAPYGDGLAEMARCLETHWPAQPEVSSGDDLSRIQKLAHEATPDWTFDEQTLVGPAISAQVNEDETMPHGFDPPISDYDGREPIFQMVKGSAREADAKFAEAARTAVPKLVDELQQYRAYFSTPEDAAKALRKIERVRGWAEEVSQRRGDGKAASVARSVAKTTLALLDQEESGTIHE